MSVRIQKFFHMGRAKLRAYALVDIETAGQVDNCCACSTLGFCVKRHLDIETFQPKPYWSLALTVSKNGQQARCSWSGGRMMSRGKADGRFKACRAPVRDHRKHAHWLSVAFS